MKRNLMMIVLGICLTTCLGGVSALGEEYSEGLEQRMRQMSLESRELELQNQRLGVESRELEMNRLRLETEAMELRLRAARHDDDDDDDDDDDEWGQGYHGRHGPPIKHGCCIIALIALIAHILLAIWVHGDARDRSVRGGLWVALALLTGFFGAITYAIVRLGDLQNAKSATPRK